MLTVHGNFKCSQRIAAKGDGILLAVQSEGIHGGGGGGGYFWSAQCAQQEGFNGREHTHSPSFNISWEEVVVCTSFHSH